MARRCRCSVAVCILLLTVLLTSGCVLLLAGAAGGVGTAVWLSGKLTQEVNASFDKSKQAAIKAMHSLEFEITKQTTTDQVAQFMGLYSDARPIWIDIRRLTSSTSRIEVRVGTVSDQDAARIILNRIIGYL